MFVLSVLRDTVAIQPHEMGKDQIMVIKTRLNKQLANKVVPDLGLCICIYDVLEVGDTYILPGEGAGRVRVKFRFIVFRPFVDEVVEAKVVASSSAGLVLSLEFFEDIFIPAERLPQPHVFEEDGQIWYWEYASEDDDEPSAKLYMDPGKVVRFKVVDVIFKDVRPDLGTESRDEKSMEVLGTMASTGLGCVGWWNSGNDEEEEADEPASSEICVKQETIEVDD